MGERGDGSDTMLLCHIIIMLQHDGSERWVDEWVGG